MFKKGGGVRKGETVRRGEGVGEDGRKGNSFFEPVSLSGYDIILLLLLHVWAAEFRG